MGLDPWGVFGRETKRTDSGLERVSYYESGTSCIPLGAKWRPWELLAIGEAAIKLCSCLGNFGGVFMLANPP